MNERQKFVLDAAVKLAQSPIQAELISVKPGMATEEITVSLASKIWDEAERREKERKGGADDGENILAELAEARRLFEAMREEFAFHANEWQDEETIAESEGRGNAMKRCCKMGLRAAAVANDPRSLLKDGADDGK